MKQIFFVDIDTQRDLVLPTGAWYVRGAEKLIPKLRRLFDFARRHQVFVLSSADAHSMGDPEFMSFPLHCLRGTEGQQKLPETLLSRPLRLENRPTDRNLLADVRKHQQIIVEKQSFDIFANPVTEKLLRALPAHAILFGLPTEHSVRPAALGLRRRGVKTVVISDAVRGTSVSEESKAVEEMSRAGVEFVPIDDVMTISAN